MDYKPTQQLNKDQANEMQGHATFDALCCFFFVMVESRNKGRATVKQRSHLQTLYMKFNNVNNKITVKIKLILLTKMPLEEQKR